MMTSGGSSLSTSGKQVEGWREGGEGRLLSAIDELCVTRPRISLLFCLQDGTFFFFFF